QSAESGAERELQEADRDEEPGDDAADRRRAAGRAVGVAVRPPQDGAKDPPAVERVSGYQVERGEKDVDRAEPAEHRPAHPGAIFGGRPAERGGDHDAREPNRKA